MGQFAMARCIYWPNGWSHQRMNVWKRELLCLASIKIRFEGLVLPFHTKALFLSDSLVILDDFFANFQISSTPPPDFVFHLWTIWNEKSQKVNFIFSQKNEKIFGDFAGFYEPKKNSSTVLDEKMTVTHIHKKYLSPAFGDFSLFSFYGYFTHSE